MEANELREILQGIEGRLNERLNQLETRLSEHIDERESRLREYIDEHTHDAETRIVCSFGAYQQSAAIYLRKIQADVSNVNASTSRWPLSTRSFCSWKPGW
jgi:hypothetical protein